MNLLDTGVGTSWFVIDPENLAGPGGEVRTIAALGAGTDAFGVFDTDADNDFWILGANGGNWNGDMDVDAAFLGIGAVEQVGLLGQEGNDAITARGVLVTGGQFPGPGTVAVQSVIEGADTNDFLLAGPGDETLRGFGGADELEGSTGTNLIQGGNGDDRATYFSNVGVTVDLGVTGPQNTGIGIDTLTGVEGLDGTNHADTLIGDGGANALSGRDGNDTLDGRGGNDSLQGGPDVDTATYQSAPAAVRVNLDANSATGGDDSFDSNVENLIGSPFADALIGDASNNAIVALAGTDTVSALGGADDVRVRDGGPDTASCGSEIDTAIADRASVDSVNPDCENVSFLPEDGDGDGNGGPSNEFTFGKVKRNKRKGTAKLPAEVPGPGALELTGKGLKPDSEEASGAGEVRLKVKAKGRKKEKLNRKGKAKVRPEVTFTPTGGASNTQANKVKLVKR